MRLTFAKQPQGREILSVNEVSTVILLRMLIIEFVKKSARRLPGVMHTCKEKKFNISFLRTNLYINKKKAWEEPFAKFPFHAVRVFDTKITSLL
jgi:hypothetical protein